MQRKNFRIPVAEPLIGEEELQLVVEAIKSGWISSQGRFIEEFEQRFAEYIGVSYGVAVCNGTVALHLALSALGIGSGDEVIIPTLTFAAVANAVVLTGAKPVFVDSHATYWCIDPEKIREKISSKTKAIIAVHLYGHPCDMDALLRIASEHDLYLIEDCAEAHGAEYKSKKVGSFGDISCFSFYANKIMTTGEGGMCLTNDEKLAEKMRILRNHGMSPQKKYWHEVVGYNYRMTNLQAALGVAQLSKIDFLVQKRREIAKIYNSVLEDVEGVKTPAEMPWAKNVYWLYTILIEKDEKNSGRDFVKQALEKEGIETRPVFYPLHQMPAFRNYATSSCSFIHAEEISKRGLSLPSSANLSPNDVKEIASIIRDVVERL